MIELKLLDAYDIPKLFEVNDDIEEYIIGDRSDWIQFLSQRMTLEDSGMWIIAAMDEEEKIHGYIVIANNRYPPFSDSVVIIYAWSKMVHAQNLKFYSEIVDLIKSQGYQKIEAYTRTPEKLKNFGFKDVGFVKMEMNLG